ncbi:hypothetical protein [Streptomyces roseoviridis]|uniref:Uncharacterized protein n=1 Tax=Streptomyces roseoviridis TaxID=67361 RepID=A0ABV5QJ19_9ACTN
MTGRAGRARSREDAPRGPEAATAYEAARIRFEPGRSVRERREEPGMRRHVGVEPMDRAAG